MVWERRKQNFNYFALMFLLAAPVQRLVLKFAILMFLFRVFGSSVFQIGLY